MAATKLAKTTDAPAPEMSMEIFADGGAQLAEVREALAELSGDGMTARDFPALKMPAGGGLVWDVPTLEGSEARKTIEGIILDIQKTRKFYKDAFDGGGSPPDCSSPDGCTGHGNPGGNCDLCALAQYGSGKNNSQACSERRAMLVLTNDSALPYFLDGPPSSVGAVKQYSIKLAGSALKYWKALSAIGLEKDTNATGIVYSKLVLDFAKRLPAAEVAMVEEYRGAVMGLLAQRVAATFAEVAAGTDGVIDMADFASADDLEEVAASAADIAEAAEALAA